MTDREKLIELLAKGCDYARDKCGDVRCDECEGGNHNGCTLIYLADHLLSNGVTVQKQGRWVDHMVRDWRCSECGEPINKVRKVDGYCYDDKPNYCPNCGADMRGMGNLLTAGLEEIIDATD